VFRCYTTKRSKVWTQNHFCCHRMRPIGKRVTNSTAVVINFYISIYIYIEGDLLVVGWFLHGLEIILDRCILISILQPYTLWHSITMLRHFVNVYNNENAQLVGLISWPPPNLFINTRQTCFETWTQYIILSYFVLG